MDNTISDIMFFRLNTGEDIVAKVVFSDKEDVILYYPLKVVYLPKGNGMLSISFMQWVFQKITMDQEFIINMRDVLTMSVPSDSLVEHYSDTVDYFNTTDTVKLNKMTKKTEQDLMDEMFEGIEDELESGETVEEVVEFLKSISSNNKGTLH